MSTTNKSSKFANLITNSFKFRFYLLMNLPLGFVARLRVTELNDKKAVVTIPYRFITKNPFKSVYFAAQAMAAELSTGVLAMLAVHESNPPVSMLVFDMSANFTKKARTLLTFTCSEGDKIFDAVQKSIATGEGQTVTVKTVGTDTEGDVVSEFVFTWTFKPKSK